MRTILWLSFMVLVARPAHATFSIVAIDPATGDIGVAVGAYAFAASERVPFGQGGVGAIATQANNNVGADQTGMPNLTGDPKGAETVQQWFNPAAFTQVPSGTFGNAGSRFSAMIAKARTLPVSISGINAVAPSMPTATWAPINACTTPGEPLNGT